MGLFSKLRLPDPPDAYSRRDQAEFRRQLETLFATLQSEDPANPGGGGATTLNELTDVDTAGVVASMFLRYDGAQWIAESVGIPAELGDLQDVDLSPAPTDGQVLTYNSGTGFWEPQDAAGGTAEFQRTAYVITTGSLAISATENGTKDLTVSASVLLRVQADRACRVRLYSTSAARTADASRPIGTDPDPGEGLLCEFVFTSTELDETADPTIILKNMDNPVDTDIYYAIENRSGGTSAVVVTLTVIESVLALAAVPAAVVTAGTFGSGAFTFPANLTVTGDLTVTGQNLNLGLTKDLALGSVPYHILYGGHTTTPSQVIIGANSDPAIYLDATNSIWFRDLGGTVRFQFNVNGTPYIAMSGVQVIATRRTGWALPSGTLSRATFDQSTVTLPQLAQRVAALITDMYSGHGLIGA
jgi:hypothetical protein